MYIHIYIYISHTFDEPTNGFCNRQNAPKILFQPGCQVYLLLEVSF